MTTKMKYNKENFQAVIGKIASSGAQIRSWKAASGPVAVFTKAVGLPWRAVGSDCRGNLIIYKIDRPMNG